MKSFLNILLLIYLSVNCVFAKDNSDTTIIRTHLTAITKTGKFRTYKNLDQLNKTAEYIENNWLFNNLRCYL
jgi:hypothetical protein